MARTQPRTRHDHGIKHAVAAPGALASRVPLTCGGSHPAQGPPPGAHTHTSARLGEACSARKRLGDAISNVLGRGLSPVKPSSKASVSSWLPSEVLSRLRASERASDLRGEAGGAMWLLLAVAAARSAWPPPLTPSAFFRAFFC